MPTVTMKAAVSAAKEALKELYDDDPLRNLALEELELVSDGNNPQWAVTLGFYRPRSVTVKQSELAAIYSPQHAQVEDRVYKTLYIDAESGEFVKMDMRQTP